MLHILNHRPPVILTSWWPWQPVTLDPPGVLIVVPQENYEPQAAVNWYHDEWLTQHPNLKLYFMANSDQKYTSLVTKVPAIQSNQPAFANYRIFRPLNTLKKYDAVYNARVLPLKRHHLATKIPNWAWVTSNYGSHEPIWRIHYEQICRFPGIHPLNTRRDDGTIETFNRSQVNHAINQAHVGLCLSTDKEGAMIAQVEYLLAGLPVVTTRATGGREDYHHPDFTHVLSDDPTPQEVADAVQRFHTHPVDSDYIRQVTLRRMFHYRMNFLRSLQNILLDLNVQEDILLERWSYLYQDCFYTTQDADKLNQVLSDLVGS
jgi:hypothetical protein